MAAILANAFSARKKLAVRADDNELPQRGARCANASATLRKGINRRLGAFVCYVYIHVAGYSCLLTT